MTKQKYVERIQNCLKDLTILDSHGIGEESNNFLKMYGILVLIGEITNEYIHQVEKDSDFNE